MRALGSLAIRGAWGRPGETGDGTGGYPLMGYEYVLGEGAGFVNGVETVVGDGVLEVRSGGLGAGVVYAGKVRARNDAGYSNWTGVEEAMALYVPSTPRSLTLALGVESITVSYQVPAETGLGDSARAATGYEVVVSAPCMVQETRVVSGDVFAVTFSRLEKGCVFTFKTRATNEAGSSNYTAEVRTPQPHTSHHTPYIPHPQASPYTPHRQPSVRYRVRGGEHAPDVRARAIRFRGVVCVTPSNA